MFPFHWQPAVIDALDGHICNRCVMSFPVSAEDLSFRWMLNEFPDFIPLDKRRFVSQTTGNLYISTVRASDSGNYSCFVHSPSIAKSVFSKFIPLVPIAERESFPEDVETHAPLTPVLCLLILFLQFLPLKCE